ncbi:hypothetical protein IWW43_005786, partial [Coemansia sp. RSA 1935]
SEISTIEEPEAEVVTQPEQRPSHAAARVSAMKTQEVFETKNTPIDNLIGNAAVSGPGSYRKVMSSNESAKWKDAVSAELESIDNNDVFEISIRIVCALAAQFGLTMHNMDVNVVVI